jgi:hypothetical protein
MCHFLPNSRAQQTWDRFSGLKSALRGALSASMSGIPFTFSSIGGRTALYQHPFVMIRDEELLLRWLELASLLDTVLFADLGCVLPGRSSGTAEYVDASSSHVATPGRTGDDDISRPLLQLWDSPKMLEALAKWTRVRAIIAPYVQSLIDQAVETGMPPVRPMPMWSTYGTFGTSGRETRAKSNFEQFMLGNHWVVCPAMQAGATEVTCEVPPSADDTVGDGWRELCVQRNEQQQGGHWGGTDASSVFKCHSPLGRPCILVRSAGDEGVKQMAIDVEAVLCPSVPLPMS